MNHPVPDSDLVHYVASLGYDYDSLSFDDKLKAKESFEKNKSHGHQGKYYQLFTYNSISFPTNPINPKPNHSPILTQSSTFNHNPTAQPNP